MNIFHPEAIKKNYSNTKRRFPKVVKAKKDEEAAQKFSQYFDWKESISRIPSTQTSGNAAPRLKVL